MAKAANTQSQPKATKSGLAKILDLKKKIDEQNARRGSGGDKYLSWFKAKPGDNVKVRILPLSFLDAPFVAVAEHNKLHPNQPFRSEVCPKSVGEGECPICDYVFTQYRDAKERDDKNAMSFLKTLMPKQKAYCLIYNRATGKIEKLGMSFQLLGQILSEIEAADVDPTDPHEGRDGRIKVVMGQNGFPNYSFSLSELSTSIGQTAEETEGILKAIEDHKEEVLRLRAAKSPDELKGLLKFDASDDDADDDESTSAGMTDEDAEAEADRLLSSMGGGSKE